MLFPALGLGHHVSHTLPSFLIALLYLAYIHKGGSASHHEGNLLLS